MVEMDEADSFVENNKKNLKKRTFCACKIEPLTPRDEDHSVRPRRDAHPLRGEHYRRSHNKDPGKQREDYRGTYFAKL